MDKNIKTQQNRYKTLLDSANKEASLPKSDKSRRIAHIKNIRASFTMLEVVFVILITGLVSVAGGKAIVQILQNYALQKDFSKLEMESTSVISQISKYLQNSVWDSIALAQTNNATNACQTAGVGLVSIKFMDKAGTGEIKRNGNMLCFIEKNMDAINGRYVDAHKSNIPYFSGFINLDLSSQNNFVTQFESDAIRDMEMLFGVNGTSLYFPFINVGTDVQVYEKYYKGIAQNKAIFAIDKTFLGYNLTQNGTAVKLDTEWFTTKQIPTQISDVAVIVNANASYIILEDGTDTSYQKGDLVVSRRHSNANTWEKSIIARNISSLYLWTEDTSSLIRIRVCLEPSVAKSIMSEFCKEGIIMQ